jgi:hypothetical protein
VPNTALATEDQLEDILQFVGTVDELKRLPARPAILRTLDELIKDLGGQPAPGSQSDGPWSKPDGPSQWAKAFGYSVDTLMRRFKAGTIRHKKETSKSYRIHVNDLPK